MPFHRVIKNYVIQGGDSQGLGTVEDWILKGKSNGQLAIRFASLLFWSWTTDSVKLHILLQYINRF